MSITNNFIDLDRRFEEYITDETPTQLAERSYYSLLNNQHGISWEELLKNRITIILGEPGSGKSYELSAQHQKIGSTSFFLPLNRLVTENVIDIFNDEDLRKFKKWKSNSYQATFFLDSVDESKIQQDNDFFLALDRVKKAIGTSLIRARFVISSRISEWRPQSDKHGVLQRFGIEPTKQISSTQEKTVIEEQSKLPGIKIVTLLPLDVDRVKRYAIARGVAEPHRFIHALDQHNAWAFAGRPLDVSHLYEYWNEKNQLGNLTDLSEYMIGRLLAEVANKEKRDPLSPENARLGAEYLAAAVVFCRNLKISIADDNSLLKEKMISPASVLPKSWTSEWHRSVTNRALFDSPSHGAISFHHRYHTEFLTASWIEGLMENNCGLEALEDLLFARVDGKRVLRNGLEPVAAWLAKSGNECWRFRFQEWLLETAPEIHLRYGDPAALSLDYRRNVLAKLIERYRDRGWVRLNSDRSALARFANLGLNDDINRYLLDPGLVENLRSDLLIIVSDGKLIESLSIVLQLFADPNSSDNLRTIAAMVIRDIGEPEHRKELSNLCVGISKFSNSLLGCLCEALFPQAIDVNGLLNLLQKSCPVREYSFDLQYVIRPLLEQKLNAISAKELLLGILTLLEMPPLLEVTNLSEKHIWMVSLIPTCLQHMLSQSNIQSEDLCLAVSTIVTFEKATHGINSYLISAEETKDKELLRGLFYKNTSLRSSYFWQHVSAYRLKNGSEPKIFEFTYNGNLITLSKEDLSWLLQEAKANLPLNDRRLAMEISADLFCSVHYPLLPSLWHLLNHTNGEQTLLTFCHHYFWKGSFAPFRRFWLTQFRHKLLYKEWWKTRYRRFLRSLQNIRDKYWLWRHLSNLKKGEHTKTLCAFARDLDGSSSEYSRSDWDKLTNNWNKMVILAVKQGCTVAWKAYKPAYQHENDNKNFVDHRIIVGLVGLQTLWRESRLDFSGISADEVGIAIRYACNELNGLPEWFQSLIDDRPKESADALNTAIQGEWNLPADIEHVNFVLSKLARISIPAEITQNILSQLQARDPFHPKILEYALSAIFRTPIVPNHEIKSLAAIRVDQYAKEQPQWITWLNLWIQLDTFPALDYLENLIGTLTPQDSDSLMIRLCAFMSDSFGERYRIEKSLFLKPEALLRFIPLVHRYIRPDQDIERTNQGVYSPGLRDHAQDLRNGLWEGLKNHRGPEADKVLITLLNNPIMTDRRDWILHLLDNRKSFRVDDTVWLPGDIRGFTELHCSEPRSDYQLFRRIIRLLNEIKNDIEISENASNRLQLRKDDLEKVFRGFLAEKLKELSLDWFVVTQESEVDLEQRPDITIGRSGLNNLPIEVKLANLKHWTLPILLERLENQVVGQYLRPANVRHGVYVLGNTDPKRFWKEQETGENLSFEQIVQRIQKRAADLQAEMLPGVDAIEVIGIDFSDPRERKILLGSP